MLFSFWTGPLTWLERLCMTSMVANGHSLTLYSFDPPDVPSNVIVKDAREIMQRDKFVVYRRNGSPALFANLFRYEGLRHELGIWVDTDVLVLRNLSGLGNHIFGLEDESFINGAILRLPADSPALRDMLEYCNQRVVIPLQWPLRRKLRQRIAGWFGGHKRLQDLPWGTIGPRLITHYAHEHGLEPLPRTFFYPYGPDDAGIAFEPSERVEDRFTANTHAVHLWNKRIKPLKASPPPAGSFLSRMCEKYDIDISAKRDREA